jgi:hypothetical protein
MDGDGTRYAPREDNRRSLMIIQWRQDVDEALNDAETQERPVLLDFSAAPM